MFGSFRPRLESLGDRVCLSAVGGEVMAVDAFKPGEEAGLIGLLHSGEEAGAAVDYKVGEAGWDVKPGEEQGAAVNYDLLVPAVRNADPPGEKGAGVDDKGGENILIGLL